MFSEDNDQYKSGIRPLMMFFILFILVLLHILVGVAFAIMSLGRCEIDLYAQQHGFDLRPKNITPAQWLDFISWRYTPTGTWLEFLSLRLTRSKRTGILFAGAAVSIGTLMLASKIEKRFLLSDLSTCVLLGIMLGTAVIGCVVAHKLLRMQKRAG